MKYLLQGQLIAKDGEIGKLTEIMKHASKLMLEKAKGCELYVVGHSEENKDAVYITEIWTTKEDHKASLSAEGVRELIGEAMPILADIPTKGREINVIS